MNSNSLLHLIISPFRQRQPISLEEILHLIHQEGKRYPGLRILSPYWVNNDIPFIPRQLWKTHTTLSFQVFPYPETPSLNLQQLIQSNTLSPEQMECAASLTANSSTHIPNSQFSSKEKAFILPCTTDPVLKDIFSNFILNEWSSQIHWLSHIQKNHEKNIWIIKLDLWDLWCSYYDYYEHLQMLYIFIWALNHHGIRVHLTIITETAVLRNFAWKTWSKTLWFATVDRVDTQELEYFLRLFEGFHCSLIKEDPYKVFYTPPNPNSDIEDNDDDDDNDDHDSDADIEDNNDNNDDEEVDNAPDNDNP